MMCCAVFFSPFPFPFKAKKWVSAEWTHLSPAWLVFQICTEQVCWMPERFWTLTEASAMAVWGDLLSEEKKTAENKEEVLVRLFKYPIHHHVDLNPKICFGECPQVTFEGVSLGFPYLILASWPVIDFLLETAQLDHGF